MNKIYAVITGDIVKSSDLNRTERATLLKVLKEIFEKINGLSDEKEGGMPFEIYRGDSFQGVLSDPVQALKVCLLFKVSLRASTETTLKKAWDARIALGLGSISFISEKGAEGDGEAFRRSGPELDDMKGDNRLKIRTPWKEVDQELDVLCSFADVVISRWTTQQAEVILGQMEGLTQQQIASRYNISQVAVHHRLKNSGWTAMSKFLDRYEIIIKKRLKFQ